MLFNVSAIKNALLEAGHEISEGEHLLVSDMEELFDYAYRHLGLSKTQVAYGMAYPTTIPATFPGHPDAAAAPVVEPEAPAQPAEAETPVETAPVAETPAAPVVEQPVAETPAAEPEAPAAQEQAGEQAAPVADAATEEQATAPAAEEQTAAQETPKAAE